MESDSSFLAFLKRSEQTPDIGNLQVASLPSHSGKSEGFHGVTHLRASPAPQDLSAADTDPILDSLVADEQDLDQPEDLEEYANEGGSGWNFEAETPSALEAEAMAEPLPSSQSQGDTFLSVVLENELVNPTPPSNVSAQGSMEHIPSESDGMSKKKGIASFFFPRRESPHPDKQPTAEERRKSDSDQKRKEKREQQMIRNSGAWQNEILPNWEEKKETRRVIELAEEGIPPKFRGKAWLLSLGNDLNITEELFSIGMERARVAWELVNAKRSRMQLVSASSENISAQYVGDLAKEEIIELIALDLTTTFPSLGIFQKGGPLNEPLRNVLEAYVCYRPDVGYVQGMSHVAAMLLLNMDTFDAFQALCNMLNRKCHRAFSKSDTRLILCYKRAFEALFIELLPNLHSHFHTLGVESDLFLFDWFVTLFSRALPLEVASRIWDVYFLQGEIVLFKAALAVLQTIESRLLNQPFDVIIHMLTHPLQVEEHEVFHYFVNIILPEKRFQAVLYKYVPRT